MELFLLIFYLIVWFGLTQKRKSMEGYFSVFFVFGLAGFAYFTLIPFEMYLKGEDYFFVNSWIKLGSVERNLILLLSIISLFGFYFGLKLSKYRLFSVNMVVMGADDRPDRTFILRTLGFLLCIVFICFSALILFYRDIFTAQYDYTTAYSLTYKSPLYSLLKMHLLIALALIAGIIMRTGYGWKGKLIFIAIVISILSVGILTADKDPLLIALLTAGCIFKLENLPLKKFVALTLIGSITVIILVPLFNLYRTRMPLADVIDRISLSSISFTRLDPGGPMHSLASIIGDDSLQLKYGSTYINSLGVLIPKVIWPDRPLDLSEEFAKEYISDWSEGQGFGYSPLAEAYVNFSIPGAFIHFFIYGLLIGSFLQFLRTRVLFNYEFILVPFIFIVGYYTVILSFRSPLIGPIKMVMMFMGPYFLLAIILKALGKMMQVIKRLHSNVALNT